MDILLRYILGICVCVLLLVVVLAGRGWTIYDDMFGIVDDGIECEGVEHVLCRELLPRRSGGPSG
jgi:hypothetical protein